VSNYKTILQNGEARNDGNIGTPSGNYKCLPGKMDAKLETAEADRKTNHELMKEIKAKMDTCRKK
jgi:hypothetical protein